MVRRGEINLCYNAVDRHLEERGDQNALIYVSTEADERREYTYRDLYNEVNAFAATLKELGVGRGDRVVIYIRALRGQDPEYMQKHDTSTLRNLLLASEPLDEPRPRAGPRRT